MAMLGGECSACCGGACSECAPSHVSITIASNDFLRHSEWRSMYGQTYKDSWGIIASPLSGTFRLSLARCSTPFGFPNAYEFVYESDEISYPGSGKIVAKFFNEPGVVARHLFTIEAPVTVCRGLNYKSYDPNNYKFYSLTEMLTPQYESFGGSTLVSVSAGVGKTSTTFVCSGQASSSRSYIAVGGVNAYDGQANDAAEGASPPCVVWSFDPTSTDAITVPNAQGYGYLRHYQPNMYGWTELSRSDVTTGQNAVTVSSVEFDCNSLQKGACCEGASCTVKPQCQCQGAGQVFNGVGTTCAGVSLGACCRTMAPVAVLVTLQGWVRCIQTEEQLSISPVSLVVMPNDRRYPYRPANCSSISSTCLYDQYHTHSWPTGQNVVGGFFGGGLVPGTITQNGTRQIEAIVGLELTKTGTNLGFRVLVAIAQQRSLTAVSDPVTPCGSSLLGYSRCAFWEGARVKERQAQDTVSCASVGSAGMWDWIVGRIYEDEYDTMQLHGSRQECGSSISDPFRFRVYGRLSIDGVQYL